MLTPMEARIENEKMASMISLIPILLDVIHYRKSEDLMHDLYEFFPEDLLSDERSKLRLNQIICKSFQVLHNSMYLDIKQFREGDGLNCNSLNVQYDDILLETDGEYNFSWILNLIFIEEKMVQYITTPPVVDLVGFGVRPEILH